MADESIPRRRFLQGAGAVGTAVATALSTALDTELKLFRRRNVRPIHNPASSRC